ncbi:hypothetical protein [Salegentibacter sediminis]|uniref:hypothetical protein n=1 Tax=Salegentibacter sediminis TaxID=1930251 RepID=UPI0009BC93B6|nr:hypothetical protein [Salegentibacter sediminis]
MAEKIILNSKLGTQNITPQTSNGEKEKAIEAINQLLDKENIEFIYYIDDKIEVGQQESYFKGMMNTAKMKSHSFEHPIFKDLNSNLPNPVFQQKVKDLWDNESDKKKLIHEVSMVLENEESSNIIPSMEIEEFFPEKLKLLTPNDWIQKYKKDLSSIGEDKKILCLFDFELHDFKGPNGEKNGADLLKNVLESEFNNKVICGIFSHHFSIEDEDEYRRIYSDDYEISPKKFYTVSKTRFAHDPKLSAFAEGIKNVVSLPYLEDLKEKSIDIIIESNQSSITELSEISPKTYNRIVQRASYKEGIWEVEGLFRMSSILNTHHNFKTLMKDEIRQSFDDSIKQIRELDSVATGYNHIDEDKKAVDLRFKEVFLDGELLTKLHFPVGNGDIFKIGKKEYILLVQPCNIALRSDAKRGRGFNIGTLVPLKVISKQKYNAAVSSSLVDPETGDGEVSCAFFAEFKTIPLDILDLTVFNENSEAILDMAVSDLESNDILIPSWKKRYEIIYKDFKKEEIAYLAFEKLKPTLKDTLDKTEIDKLKSFFEKPSYVKQFSLGKHNIYNADGKRFDFNIKRIKRYQFPYSADLLQSFMAYQARNGFDVEFV